MRCGSGALLRLQEAFRAYGPDALISNGKSQRLEKRGT